jgi:FkbM family methyltransferase
VIRLVQHKEWMLADDEDVWIGREVLATGEFDFGIVQRTFDLLGKRQTLFDIGANIGTVCIPAIVRGFAERAVAVEPEPFNFRLLRCNAILNEVDDRIDFHQTAAGSEFGTVLLRLAQDGNRGDHRVGNNSHSGLTIQVPIEQMSQFEVSPNDLVWLDVQGSEPAVLEGWPAVLEQRIPLVVEMAPTILASEDCFDRLLDCLSAYEWFTDLRGDCQMRPIKDLKYFCAAIATGTHRDLLMR